jgi:hypothetical protein
MNQPPFFFLEDFVPEKTEEIKVTQALEEAVNPDLVEWESFKVGDRTFQIRPLPFKWDKVYRSYAMPILGAELKPLETLMAALSGSQLAVGANQLVTQALIESELEIDLNLARAAGAICASQDEQSKNATDKKARAEHWANQVDVLTRYELTEIVRKQSDVQKDLQRLGESLRKRFERLASLTGKNFDLGGLLPPLMPPSTPPSVPTGTNV